MADPDTHKPAPMTIKDTVQGAVPQKHRNKLGQADGMTNPNGVGNPSTKSMIGNGNKGW